MSAMNVPMATIAAKGILNDPVAQKLSPAAIAALQAAASNPSMSPSPALVQAMVDAKQAGYEPQGFSWAALGKGLGVAGLFALGGLGLGALTSGGTSAGISSATAPEMFAGQIASDVAPASTGGFGNALLGLVGGKGGALSAGLNVASAALGSNAAHTASQQQIDAQNKAKAESNAAYAPYQAIGAQGLTGLGNLQPFQPPTPRSVADTRAGIEAPASQGMGLGNIGQSLRPNESTTLPPAQEQAFQQWIARNKTAPGIANYDDPSSRYDMRGFFADEAARAQWKPGDHFPDTYKQHGHPTFSQESRYSSGPSDGGMWNGDNFIAQPRMAVSHVQPRMVTLRGPDGSTRSVPQASAQAIVQASNGQVQVVQ